MARALPPLNAIRAFEAVARHEHLGHAASELHVTHSTVSQHVRHLEDWFGQPLFAREKARIHLNDSGRRLLDGYSQALDLMLETGDQLLNENAAGKLTIHCDPPFFARVLMGLMETNRGEAEIEVVTARPTKDCFPDGADILIDINPHGNWRNVHSEHLMDLHGFPACSPKLLEKVERPSRPLDLRKLPLLHGCDRASWNTWLVEFAGATSIGCQNCYFDDFNMTIAAALRGQGVIMADPILCKDELESGALLPLFDGTIHELGYYAFCPQQKYGTRAIRKIFDRLVKDVRNFGQTCVSDSRFKPRPLRG